MGDLAGAENMLTAALGRLFALAEAYPDLKANQNMMQPPGGADLDREPGRLRPPGLQRLGDGLQQPARGLPGQHHRRHASASTPAALFEIEDPQERATPQVSFDRRSSTVKVC